MFSSSSSSIQLDFKGDYEAQKVRYTMKICSTRIQLIKSRRGTFVDAHSTKKGEIKCSEISRILFFCIFCFVLKMHVPITVDRRERARPCFQFLASSKSTVCAQNAFEEKSTRFKKHVLRCYACMHDRRR